VLLDARTEDDSITSVVPDEYGGAVAATTHLVEAGHRRIGYIQNVDPIPASKERLAGFRRALELGGVSYVPAYVEVDLSDSSGGYSAGMALLDRTERPTGVFCFNDRMAVGVARAARHLGLDVPGDISLVGFDNQELVAPLIEPPLTTIQLPHYEMGGWAVEHLLTQIEQEDPGDVEVYRMPCPLVVRESVGPPPPGND
jgi:LacI family transcriptional regulator